MTERRLDPLTGEWRTFTTHRQHRPNLPAREDCPLCPGGLENPDGETDVFVFDNRFPSFQADPPDPGVSGEGFYEVAPAVGAAEVVIYSPEHSATMTDLGLDRIVRIVEVWTERTAVLGARDEVQHVFVFENRGEAVGVTLHHPHGQIYGYPEVPPAVRRELEHAARHREERGRCIGCEVVDHERTAGTRVVAANDSFLAYVPFAPRFPYEVHLACARHAPSLLDLSDAERRDLAGLLDVVVRAYDHRFGFVLPYVLSVHQMPPKAEQWRDVAHLRVQLTPLHRRPGTLKYLAGSELHAGAFVVDAAPENTASELRDAVVAR